MAKRHVALSNLRNCHVALSILGVYGHNVTISRGEHFRVTRGKTICSLWLVFASKWNGAVNRTPFSYRPSHAVSPNGGNGWHNLDRSLPCPHFEQGLTRFHPSAPVPPSPLGPPKPSPPYGINHTHSPIESLPPRWVPVSQRLINDKRVVIKAAPAVIARQNA